LSLRTGYYGSICALSRSATPTLHDWKEVFISKYVSELPQAVFTLGHIPSSIVW
jgi:hypothetical protein